MAMLSFFRMGVFSNEITSFFSHKRFAENFNSIFRTIILLLLGAVARCLIYITLLCISLSPIKDVYLLLSGREL